MKTFGVVLILLGLLLGYVIRPTEDLRVISFVLLLIVFFTYFEGLKNEIINALSKRSGKDN